MEKEPSHRYAGAEELADDLRRFLEGEPIRARPAPTWERGWKWAKRRPTVAALLAAVLVLTAVGVALIFGLWRGAEARLEAETKVVDLAKEKEQEQARGWRENLRLLANVTLDHGLNLCARGEGNHGLLLLARALDLAENAGAMELGRVARVNLASWRRRMVTLRAKLHHDDWAWAVAFSPDGRTALTGGKDCVACRWDTATGQQIGEPLRHRHPVWAVAFSPDGRTILTGSGDQKSHEGEARLWNAATGEPLGPPLPHPNEVYKAEFSSKGHRFLTVCDEEIRVWRGEKHFDFSRHSPLATRHSRVLPHPRPSQKIEELQPRLWAIFSPNGESVLTGGEDGTARLWDAATGAAHGQPMRHKGPVLSMVFSSDGKIIVTGSYDGTARMWDADSCRQRGPDLPHLGRVLGVDIRFDGRFVATGSAVEERDLRTGKRTTVAGEVRLWHAATGKLFGEPKRHSQKVWSVAFRPRGGKLLVGGSDRAACFYSILDDALLGTPLEHEGTVANVVFSPNGRLALTASAGGDGSAHARLWELAPGDPVTWSMLALREAGQNVKIGSIAPDGNKALGIVGNTVREYDVIKGQPDGLLLSHDHAVYLAAYSPNGRHILTVEKQFGVRFWDRTDGRLLGKHPCSSEIAWQTFSANGEWAALIHEDRSVCVYHVPTGKLHSSLLKLPARNSFVQVGSNGRAAIIYHNTEVVQEWDIVTGRVLHTHTAPGPVRFLTFAAGKWVVVTGEGSHLARAWDLESGLPMSGPLADLSGNITGFAISPDGRYIMTGLGDLHSARLWDAETGKPIGPPVHHGEAIHFVAFAADGKRMISLSDIGEFRSQEVPETLPGEAQCIRCWVELLTGMKLDAEGAVHDLDAEALQKRRLLLQQMGGPPDGVRL